MRRHVVKDVCYGRINAPVSFRVSCLVDQECGFEIGRECRCNCRCGVEVDVQKIETEEDMNADAKISFV